MANYFDAAARTWDSPDKVERSRRIAEAIARHVPIQDSWSALDYGCGTGQLTWHLGDRIDHVTLADTSPGMLEVARERASDQPGRYVVVEHDLSTGPLPYPVDLVYSALALHHIPDTGAVLRNIAASLHPGGWVALAELDADPDNHFHDDDFTGHLGIDRHHLARWLAATGFEDVAERTVAQVVKEKDGVERSFDVFLLTGRRAD